MEVLIIVVIVVVIALNQAAEKKKKQEREERRAAAARAFSRTGTRTSRPVPPAAHNLERGDSPDDRPSYDAAAAKQRETAEYPDRPLPPTEPCEETCKWSYRSGRKGEDELEALIRRNHEHEKHLEQRLMVRDKAGE